MPVPESNLMACNALILSKATSIQSLKDFVGKHPTKNMYQIYHNIAPAGSRYPHCIYKFLSSSQVQGQGRKKIFDTFIWIIKLVITGESVSGARAALADIEQTFQQYQYLTDGFCAGMTITNDIDYPEEVEGVIYHHIGYQLSIMAYTNIPQPATIITQGQDIGGGDIDLGGGG